MNKLILLWVLPLGILITGCADDVERTLSLQPGPEEGKDAFIGSCVSCGYNDNNYGDREEFATFAWTNSDESNGRSLLEFDLSKISSNAEIISAKLSLYHITSLAGVGDNSGENTAVLKRITDSWDEHTVTWDTQPATTTLNEVILPESTVATQDYTAIDVTEIVRDMVSHPETSFGLMLMHPSEVAYKSMTFASSDYTTDSSKRPKLVVIYKP